MTAYDLDPAIRPQDDLFRHVNGKWLATAEIAPDRASAGIFVKLSDDSEAAIKEIVTSLSGSEPGSEAAKVEDLYASFMDTERVAALGLAPLQPLLDEIDAITSIEELLAYFGRSIRRGTGSPMAMDVESDPADPSTYILFLEQSGIGLPDEEYYRLEQHAEILAEYRHHVATMIATAAEPIIALETQVAANHWDKVTTRDMRKMYNPMTFADLVESCGGFDWSPLFEAAGVPLEGVFVNAMPSYFTALAGLLTAARLDEWKLWARWAATSGLASLLPDELVNEQFRFYGTVLNGTPEIKPRWKRGVALVEDTLGEAVGKLYVAKHFPPDAKARMDALVANLIEAYRISITELDWMGAETKAEALRKLEQFTPKIGYPDRWFDYTGLEIKRDDLVGNALRASEFFWADELSKLGQPIRKWEWLMTPQTVNAYYHPLRNEIVFPAAILQPPFFDVTAADAENYGSIGAIIGHEIGHGFDDQGSTFDGTGALRDWWTPADREAFEARTAALVGQYDALAPAQLPDTHVNGELTLGENIGDLGGLGIAYLAWQLADGNPSVSAQQLFFYAWALSWQCKRRDEALATQIATDPHSPDEFRCNQVVRNLDAFYAAFALTESDALWLPAEQRVKIW
ncbi:MAG: peptidase M13 [Propionibacteriaceae bacterium]|nr:peptidase M13 [Propionibacteriaceae bacterium]